MNRVECVEAFARVRNGAAVIVSPGLANYPLHRAGPDEPSIYNMDMPYASPMCLGLALARPDRQVRALEGDGSMLMALGVFTTIARYQPANLGIIVFDNGRYLTTGDGQVPTATRSGTDIAAIARGAGIERASAVSDLAAYQAAIGQKGPWVVVARVDASDRDDPAVRLDLPDLVEQSILCQRRLRV